MPNWCFFDTWRTGPKYLGREVRWWKGYTGERSEVVEKVHDMSFLGSDWLPTGERILWGSKALERGHPAGRRPLIKPPSLSVERGKYTAEPKHKGQVQRNESLARAPPTKRLAEF